MEDPIKFIQDNLPKEIKVDICYTDSHDIPYFYLNLSSDGQYLRLSYDFLTSDSWFNPFTNSSCSFLYLSQGIENLEDLSVAVQHCFDFLKEHKLL